jgi:valyl-tRNA synthetase
MPHLLEAIILVLAPFMPLFSERVWVHAQVLLLGLGVAKAELLAKEFYASNGQEL